VVRCCPACDALVDDELRCSSCGLVDSWLVRVRGEVVAVGFTPRPRGRQRLNAYRVGLLEELQAIAKRPPLRGAPRLVLPVPRREPAE